MLPELPAILHQEAVRGQLLGDAQALRHHRHLQRNRKGTPEPPRGLPHRQGNADRAALRAVPVDVQEQVDGPQVAEEERRLARQELMLFYLFTHANSLLLAQAGGDRLERLRAAG